MAEGGYENPAFDPTWDDRDDDDDNDDDDDDEQEVDTTRPFQPGSASAPYHGGEQHEMQTMQHEKSGQPEDSYVETPLLGDFINNDDKKSRIKRSIKLIKDKFPNANLNKIGPIGFGKKAENIGKIVKFGPKGGETRIFKQDDKSLLSSFINNNKTSLGPEAETLIAQENDSIREKRKTLREVESEVRKKEKIEKEKEKYEKEEQDLIMKIEREQAKSEQLGSAVENESILREKNQRIKNYKNNLKNLKKGTAALEKQLREIEKKQKMVDQLSASIAAEERQRNTYEERLNSTKNLDDLNEQKDELQRKNEEDRVIIEDENTSPYEREAAEERIEERQEELARLNAQIEERERGLPLSERIKEIFKKYGVTVTAIFIAAGVTTGAVIGAITKPLKATGKALGNGLKEMAKKQLHFCLDCSDRLLVSSLKLLVR